MSDVSLTWYGKFMQVLLLHEVEVLLLSGVALIELLKQERMSTCMLRIETLRMNVTRSPREAASSAATYRQGSTSTEWLSRSNLQFNCSLT